MSYKLVEYACSDHGRHESLERRPEPDDLACPTCGKASPKVLSAPALKFQLATVTRGSEKVERPPGGMDTRPLAEGMPLNEWKAKRREQWRAERYQQFKNAGAI